MSKTSVTGFDIAKNLSSHTGFSKEFSKKLMKRKLQIKNGRQVIGKLLSNPMQRVHSLTNTKIFLKSFS